MHSSTILHYIGDIAVQSLSWLTNTKKISLRSNLNIISAALVYNIPPIWFGLAFLRTRLPCSDPTTDDKNSRVELAVGT